MYISFKVKYSKYENDKERSRNLKNYDCIRILFTLDDIKYPFPSFVYSRLFSFRIVRNVELKVKSSFEILQ